MSKERPGRNLLLVSYYFPPSGGPGVQRVLKFVRYLPSYGWRPIVLTAKETAAYPVRDPSLKAEIPADAVIRRTGILEFYDLYRRISRTRATTLATSAAPARTRRGRLADRLRAAFFIPDGRMGWFPFAVQAGRRLAAEHPPELIVASGPPFTAHWIGRHLARRLRRPLVLDFRDPWIGAPFYLPRPQWSRRLDEALERSCVREAAAFVTVNRDIGEDILHRHREVDPSRWRIIPNGFDPADFAGLVPTSSTHWNLVHTGTLPRHLPPGFLPGLETFLRGNPAAAERTRLRLLGTLHQEQRALLSRPWLENVLRVEGYRTHGESVQSLIDGQLLLLFIEEGPRARGILTGKLFEYLGSGRPILALAPDGEAADMIRATRAGRVVPPNNPGAVREALDQAWTSFLRGERAFGAPRTDLIEAYSRPRLTGSLAALCREIAGPGSPCLTS